MIDRLVNYDDYVNQYRLDRYLHLQTKAVTYYCLDHFYVVSNFFGFQTGDRCIYVPSTGNIGATFPTSCSELQELVRVSWRPQLVVEIQLTLKIAGTWSWKADDRH